jgi:hypothetical protein
MVKCLYNHIYNINLSIFRFLSYLKSWLKLSKGKRPLKRHSPSAFYRRGGIIGYKRRKTIILMIAMTTSSHNSTLMDPGFDSDSFRIKVDNCCSSSFTNNLADIVGNPVPLLARVQGFGGSITPVTHRVTIRWELGDDSGVRHSIILPNSYYAPQGEWFSSPQHWAQVAKDNYPALDGPCCITTGTHIKLLWNQRKSIKTVPLNPKSNIGIMRSAPGYNKFQAFCSEVSECDDEVALTSHVILEKGEDANPNNGHHDKPPGPIQTPFTENVHVIPPDEQPPTQTEDSILQREEPIVLDGMHLLQEIAEPSNISDQGLLLWWHVRLGHLSFKRLK